MGSYTFERLTLDIPTMEDTNIWESLPLEEIGLFHIYSFWIL